MLRCNIDNVKQMKLESISTGRPRAHEANESFDQIYIKVCMVWVATTDKTECVCSAIGSLHSVRGVSVRFTVLVNKYRYSIQNASQIAPGERDTCT